MPPFIRRILLRIGYKLPAALQRPFARYLYDSDIPSSASANTVPDNATVRLEFVGGCRDGEVFQGPSANPFFWASNHGKVGTRFSVASEAAVDALLNGDPTGPVRNHAYLITEKQIVDGVIHVRAVADIDELPT